MGMFNKELTIKEGTNDRFKMEISFSSVLVWFGFEFVPMSLFLSFTPEQMIIIFNFCGILNFKFFFFFLKFIF